MSPQSKNAKDVITKLVVAWRQGSGFRFGTVKTSARFQKHLSEITETVDAKIATMKSFDYAIGDEIENDEYMLCSLDKAERDTAVETPLMVAPPPGAEVDDWEPSVNPRRPKEFRERLVATMTEESPVGAKFLRDHQHRPIVFYAIVRGNTPGNRVAYVRHLNPMRLMKTGAVIAMLGDTLDDATHKIFAMDDRCDLIIRPKDVIVIDKNFFESLFFDLSSEGVEIDAIVSQTLSVLPFSAAALSMLVDRSRGRKRMLRKMLEIRQENQLDSVTMKDFRRAVKANGFLESRFISKGEIIAAEADGELLLQILNDDLFRGALTGKPFSATRKSRRK